MPQLKANTQFYGDYVGRRSGLYSGLIEAGEIFAATEEQAEALEARGLAYRYRPPLARTPEVASFMPQPYETKILPAAAEQPKTRRTR